MSLISYIERLRNKPEPERKKIAIGIALSVTVLIAFVWTFTIMSSISHRVSPPSANTAEKSNTYGDLKKSWDSLIEGMNTLFKGSETTEPTSTVETVDASFDAMEGIPAGLIEETATSTNQ